jgi:hypothetical protein
MKVLDSAENVTKCICPTCPSFDACMKEKAETLYCARQKSACAFEQRGCICMDCPVHKENNLSGGYYCLTGAKE